jgi:hypothetical protein
VDRGKGRSRVDHGHRLGGGSPENGRNGAPVHGTSPRLRKKGEGTAVSLTGCKRGAAEGRTRPGNGGEQSAEEALGGVNVADSEQANEGGVIVVMARRCSSPFYSGRGGARRGGGRGKRPAVMALMPLMARRLDEGLRGEIKRGNQGVE